MIVDQAEKLRLMVRSTQKTACVIAVTSGKGGVGKTNVAANLALCLVACGKKVVLFDADLGLANLDVILNIKPRNTLAHVISGKKSIEEILQPAPGGLQVVCGASGLTKMADLNEFERQRITEELESLEHKTDVIVIDTAAGISRDVLCFCDGADHTLVVTTPEPTGITDAYAMIKQLAQKHSGTKISVLVNMVESRNEAKRIYQRLASVSHNFLSIAVYDAGHVLRDEHVPQAVRQREPLVLAYPRSQASYCLLALAGKLARAKEPSVAQRGFFQKVSNWFF